METETSRHAAVLSAISSKIPGIYTLRFDVPMKFIPGQAIQVSFPGDPKKRFYSISSSPTEGPHIEITIKSESGSALGSALMSLKKGDTLDIEGPMGGSLSLPDPVQGSLGFIAAGTGVAPFRSMIRYLIDQSASVDVWLFHSVGSQSALLFQEDFRSWAATHRFFHYVPTITRDFDNNWKNETGRINDELIQKHVTDKPCTFLLCGPSTFVHDMEIALRQKLKIPADKIRREKW